MGAIQNCLGLIFLTSLLSSQVQALKGETFGQIVEAENVSLTYYTSVALTITREEIGVQQSRKTVVFTTHLSNETMSKEKNMTIVLDFGNVSSSDGLHVSSFTMRFFLVKGDYWILRNLTADIDATFDKESNASQVKISNERFVSSIELAAPQGMSFHCSKFGPLYIPRTLAPRNIVEKVAYAPTIEIREFQIQPFWNSSKKTPQIRFGTSYDCVGFFSIGILSGIFINVILMAILTWGLVMIMNVKTMDRFDDPKGKPISVGATD